MHQPMFKSFICGNYENEKPQNQLVKQKKILCNYIDSQSFSETFCIHFAVYQTKKR